MGDPKEIHAAEYSSGHAMLKMRCDLATDHTTIAKRPIKKCFVSLASKPTHTRREIEHHV